MLLAEEYIIPKTRFCSGAPEVQQGLIGEILIKIGAVEPTELQRVLVIQRKMATR